jgi:hypothetical protein
VKGIGKAGTASHVSYPVEGPAARAILSNNDGSSMNGRQRMTVDAIVKVGKDNSTESASDCAG